MDGRLYFVHELILSNLPRIINVKNKLTDRLNDLCLEQDGPDHAFTSLKNARDNGILEGQQFAFHGQIVKLQAQRRLFLEDADLADWLAEAGWQVTPPQPQQWQQLQQSQQPQQQQQLRQQRQVHFERQVSLQRAYSENGQDSDEAYDDAT